VLDRVRSDDEGFSLVETLAAMVVFAILAVSVAGVVVHSFGLTKSNASRVAAANLAMQQIEATRALRAIDVPDGATVLSPKPMVNGVEYTVTQTANYVAADSSTSLCSGASTESGVELAYKLVTVVVTWPGMGVVQPVRQDTLLSLGIGFSGVDGTKGSAAIAVTGASGQAQSGVLVTLSPAGTQISTGTDGCAVFSGLDPAGSYTAAVDQADYVGTSSAQAVSTATFNVTAGGVTRLELQYEQVGALAMTLSGPEGLLPPATLDVTLSNPGFSSGERAFPDCATVSTAPHDCVSGTPRTAAALYPGQYGAWGGTCTDARPTTAVLADVPVSGTASATLPLAGVRAEVRSTPTALDPDGELVSGHTVYALHASDGVCLAQSWPMAPAGSATPALALPQGTWTLALTADGSSPPSGGWPSVTLTTGGAVPTVVVTVP
jgi:prepilin-type N-terminal cleavage/methylation domain-containing protein